MDLVSGAPRVARGVLVSLLATCIAVAAHLIGGGHEPSPVGLMLAWVVTLAPCTAVLGRRRSAFALVPLMAVSQAVQHLILALTHHSGGSVVGAGHHGASIGAAPAAGPALGLSTSMLLTHLVATVVVVSLLAHIESVGALTGRVLATVLGIRHLVMPALPVWASLVVAAPWLEVRGPAVSTVGPCSRRGPPATAR